MDRVAQREHLSRFQRTVGWTSGYGEGWALYAERLMDELGLFADPAEEMGFLSAQAMRAARVVIDIGLHLGLSFPPDQGEFSGLPIDVVTAMTRWRKFVFAKAIAACAIACSLCAR